MFALLRDKLVTWWQGADQDPLDQAKEQELENIYGGAIAQLFRKCNRPLSTLPVLDLGDRHGHTDYIDFLQPEEMTAPVMRFVDRFRRPGIAFRLQAVHRTDKTKSVVFAWFQRYSDDKRTWSFGWGNSDSTIENEYLSQSVPFGRPDIPERVKGWLNRTDLLFLPC